MNYTRPHLRQRGATLIEVMVSALIVSFGVLAMIALQANSIKFGKTSEYRSVATLLANDLADRMKVNPAATVAGNYNLITAYSVPGTAPGLPTNQCTVACTTADLAALDLVQWRRALQFGLPGGNAYVQANSVARTVDIWVAWTDPDGTTERPNGECPAAFVASDNGAPRCMFFRIGLRPLLTGPGPGPGPGPGGGGG